MATQLFMFESGEFRINCDDEEPTIWIARGRDVVSLHLNVEQRAALRSALTRADEMAARVAA